jgi:molybdopterin-guanine dinucleotide biosynthesis protein A
MIAAIQAGGKSTRMGQDKAWLTVNGQPLISRALAAVRPIADRLLIVINPASLNQHDYITLSRSEGAELIYDLRHDSGPLAGIHTALTATGEAESVLVAACDLPFVTTEFLEFLTQEHARGGRKITVPLDPDGRLQPMLAIYSAECLPQIEDHLSRGILRVDKLFELIPTHRILPAAYEHLKDARRIFVNINTPADLAHFGAEE